MGIFNRLRNSAGQSSEVAWERGHAAAAKDEEEAIVPTLIGETSMVMDDADAVKADEDEVDRLAPGSPIAQDVEAQDARAQRDIATAQAALQDAQAAGDEADDAMRRVKRREMGRLYWRSPGGSDATDDQTVLSDRERIEKDLATASAALADADQAKAQADQDLEKARRGETGAAQG